MSISCLVAGGWTGSNPWPLHRQTSVLSVCFLSGVAPWPITKSYWLASSRYEESPPLDGSTKVHGLERDLRRTFPLLKGVRIEYRRGGPVSVPLDFFPAMGYLGRDKRVAYSLGCVGHGVALMNMAGQIMRDLLRAWGEHPSRAEGAGRLGGARGGAGVVA